ncbi:MAG TPA: sulfotransferase [Verrucomicrobiae bacterium]|jgi:Flp pilus assembly protein TadD|nr:sulfotransferase [Verrucomicrobiae bacterium]
MASSSIGDLAKIQAEPREIARWQKAQQHLLAGRHAPALQSYRELANRFPGVAQLWLELAMSAMGDIEFPLAHEALQRCLELAATDAPMLVLAGEQYQRLQRFDDARKAFELAVAADPNFTHAQLTLAAHLERMRRVDDAWGCVEEALKRAPNAAAAIYFRAFLLHRRGQNVEAETALRELIKSAPQDLGVKSSSRHLLGVVLDELGKPAEAMHWLGEAKALVRHTANAVALQKIYDQTDRRRRVLMAELNRATIDRWRQDGRADTHPYRLAFLGGHPRSGTTLVEQILGAHPAIMAFDEPEAFMREVVTALTPSDSARGLTLDGLNALSAAQRQNLRHRYWKSLLRDGNATPDAQVVVDKNPSPTSSLPVWLRMFPDVKVIIPLRDPRDVVLSCYFQNLTLTAGNVNFLSLQGAAQHFADLMDVWLRMKAIGGFDWIETRYESVVENLEAEGRRVTEFTGLPWHAQQAKFYESAKTKFVFAPTYHDVTKPAHKRAIGRWEKYAEQLAPVMEKLRPYCEALGYS